MKIEPGPYTWEQVLTASREGRLRRALDNSPVEVNCNDLVILAKEPEPVVTWLPHLDSGALYWFVDEASGRRSLNEAYGPVRRLIKLTVYPGQKRAEAEVIEERE